jgi:hypothetical protein
MRPIFSISLVPKMRAEFFFNTILTALAKYAQRGNLMGGNATAVS